MAVKLLGCLNIRYYFGERTFAYVLAGLVFLVSLYFSPYYYAGDQVAYSNYYDAVVGKNLFDAYFLQIKMLSSYEPVYACFVWFFSHFVKKDIFDSFLNLLLCYSAINILFQLGSSKRLIFLIVLSNFYILVLYFAADRLKLSFIFFFFGMTAFYNKKELKGIMLLLLSVLAHLQILLFFFSGIAILLSKSMFKITTKFMVNVKELFFLVFFSVFVMLIFISFNHHISNKLSFYLSDNITEIFKPAVFLFLSLFSATNIYYVVASFIPLLIAAFLVSGDRVVMMAYFLFMFYSIGGRGIPRILVWITSLYFSYKSYFFIHDVILFGNGFV